VKIIIRDDDDKATTDGAAALAHAPQIPFSAVQTQ
jgi:hypothetical protein